MSHQTPESRTKPPRAGALLVESGQVSSARDLAEIVFKHLGFASAIFIAVLILSVAVVYLMPPYYESTSKVLVERGKRPTQRSDILEYPLEAFEAITSEMEIITSRTVAEDVVDRLRLVDAPRRDTLGRRIGDALQDLLDRLGLLTRLSRRESLIKNVQQSLRVEPVPQSSVLAITYGAESPTEAAQIATAVTESYLAQHGKIFRADTANFFEERVAEIGKELTAARDQQRRETDLSRSQALLLEVSVLEKAYTFYRDKLNTARADMVADESLVNVRIIDSPVPAARPARSRMFSLSLAAAGGLLLAVALSLLREYFDHNIYSEREIDGYVDLPVLGSVVFVPGLDVSRAQALPATAGNGRGRSS
jgi:uncharacterized protein involved in exopolysaccharide biosynthesis